MGKVSGPLERFRGQYDQKVDCAWCQSSNTSVSNPFGGTVSEIIFTCGDCGETFGWMKWEHTRNHKDQNKEEMSNDRR